MIDLVRQVIILSCIPRHHRCEQLPFNLRDLMGFSNSRVSCSTLILSFLPCCFHLFLSPLCMAIDTISPSQSLTDGETLVSAEAIFELGFFSPGNSTNRYVGIWYKKISYRQVVWVLNSITPITNFPGTLAIKSDGNLVLLDAKEKVLWYTNASTSSNNTVAVLDDLGNFALRQMEYSNGSVLFWQSFDHPSNTLIPHMKLGGNDKLGLYLTLTSWISENNPAPGNFFLNRDRKSVQQIFIIEGPVSSVFNWTNEVKHFRSGQWDGRTFVGIPGMSQDYINGITFTSDGYGGQYYTYSTSSGSNIFIEVLDASGNLVGKLWDEQQKEWVDVWSVINSQCDIYGTCGPFGICNKMESSICRCMRGFQPKFPEKWRKGNWSDGCVRSSQLNCGSDHDGFLRMERMKLPDFAEYVQVQDQNACHATCLNNCSCLAYAYISGPGCLVWSKDLIDVQHFSSDGKDLFLRLPYSELGRASKIRAVVMIFIALSAAFSILLVTILYKLHRSKGKQKGTDKKSSKVSDMVKITDTSSDSLEAIVLLDSVKNGEDQELQLFDFDSVEMATNNFCLENKIGKGGFGIVYKGDLPTGQAIAVKRLSRTSRQGMAEFKNEVTLISKLQHRNLVKLVGVCIEGEEKLLLYEYLHNKSLDKILFDPKRKVELDWTKRFRIIEGISCGLLYLHRDSRLRVIHRDLKASNILLDEDMIPKISDFGMARSFGKKQDLANTHRVVGTYGYMAPEYAIQGIFSEKSDVFSFGVLLLEIVSGVKNTSFRHDEHLSLLGYAWQLWNDGKGMQFIDQAIVKSCHPLEPMRCIHIGLLCVQDFAVDRPTMSEVLFMLSTKTTLPPPKIPAYIQDRNDNYLNSYGSDECSINKCSITTMQSR